MLIMNDVSLEDDGQDIRLALAFGVCRICPHWDFIL